MDYINPTREEFIQAYCDVKLEDTPYLRFKVGKIYDMFALMVKKIPIPIHAEEVVYLDKLWELSRTKDKGMLQDYSIELDFAAQKLLENYP
jgi:hypothetical protein